MKTKFTFLLALSFIGLSIGMLSGVEASAQGTLDSGLVAKYYFNGDANDESGNANHGTVNGATLTTDRFGNENSAYSFDGTGNFIEVSDNSTLRPDEITISAWVFMTTSFDGAIVGKGNYNNASGEQYLLFVNTNDNIAGIQIKRNSSCQAGIGWNGVGASFVLGYWKHVIGSFDGSILKFYIDNVLVDTNSNFTQGSIDNCTGGSLRFGKWWAGETRYFNGLIDDIRIYNRALNTAEITALYQEGGYSSLNQGLVAHYPFNGNANDESGNGNNGTVNGATLTTDRFGNTNKAYDFDGVSNTISTTFTPTNVNSISIWFNAENSQPFNAGLFSTYYGGSFNGYYVGFQNLTIPILTIYRDGNLGDTLLFNGWNQWNNLTIVSNGTSIDYFINGIYKKTSSGSTTHSSTFVIGDSRYDSQFFNGKIDDIRIYNRSLNQSEITALYQEGGYSSLNQGLVAHYPFNGNANDESGNGNNGTVNGATLTTDRFGNVGKAYSFDGVNDFIQTSLTTPLNLNDFSFSVWYNKNSYSSNIYCIPISKSAGYDWNGISVRTVNYSVSISENVTNSEFIGLGTINENEWINLIVVRQNNVFYIYENGILVSTLSKQINLTNNYSWIFGDQNNSDQYTFSGKIDDIRIYNRALNETEITALYQEGGWSSLNQGLVAHYPFNGNANDESGNNNNGTVNGATLTADRFGNADKAYSFDGNNNFIQVANSSDFNMSEITISLWLKSTQTTCVPIAKLYESVPLFEAESDFRITMEHGPRFIYTDTISQDHNYRTDTLAWNNGEWHNILCVYKEEIGTSAQIYFDGILQSGSWTEGNGASKMIFQNVDLFIGKQDLDYPASCGYVNGAIDDIRIYNRALTDQEITALYQEGQSISATITIPDTTQNITQALEIPINTSTLQTSDSIIAYQFNLAYDSSKLQYSNNSLTGTIANGGSVTVNSGTAGILNVSYMTSTPLSGTGAILKLQFNPLQVGTSDLTISDFLYNTDTITSIDNGIVTIIGNYGDVDANTHIQAYDAALTLQYSVGLDPLPAIDPLPWENWRVIVANVDGVAPVTANDASLILQYSAGLISTFPVEGGAKSIENIADIAITQDGNELVFTSTGNLFGLNISAVSNPNVMLGTPQILATTMLSATNISGTNYKIGLCTATAIAENTNILRIPFTCTNDVNLTFDMFVNEQHVTKTVLITNDVTGINKNSLKTVTVFPNPTTGKVYINSEKPVTIKVYNVKGELIMATDNSKSNSVSLSEKGEYLFELNDGKNKEYRKVVVQ